MRARFHSILLALAFAWLALDCSAASVSTTTNLLNLTTVIGTNNGTSVALTGVWLPPRTFIFQHTGITNLNGTWGSGSFTTNGVTNAIVRYVQISLDNVNWTSIYTNVPSSTNASLETVTPSFNDQSIYIRVQTVTTNGIGAANLLQTP